MNGYRVFFYKDLLNSSGHNFKCLQCQIDVQPNDPSQALALAEQQIGNEHLNVDCVEVVHLADDPRGLEHPSVHANGESSSSSFPRRLLSAAINHQAGHFVLTHFAAGVTASRR